MSNCYVCGAALSSEHTRSCDNCGETQPEKAGDATSQASSDENIQSSEVSLQEHTSPQGDAPAISMSTPPTPPPMPGKRSWLSSTPAKILIGVLILVILAGGATSYYFYQVTRHKPGISVESAYQSHALPAGSTNTTMTVKGSDFSHTSSITILLDGQPLQGQPNITSDTSGKTEAMLTIDGHWALGKHILTAKDSDGYTTQSGAPIYIVKPGEADTPGPNGAPSDDESFSIMGQTDKGVQLIINVTGQPDPKGGQACPNNDDGQTHTMNEKFANGVTYMINYAATCSGTYKSGKVSVTETITRETYTYTEQGMSMACAAKAPFTSLKIEGTVGADQNFSGTYTYETMVAICEPGNISATSGSQHGTWTGSAVSS